MDTAVIKIAALGRPLHPGMLYDCRNDTFIPGVSMWDEAAIERDMSVKPQPQTSFNFTASDSLSEKTNLLKVSASLKASFLAGLVEVGGSASYLNDKASSMHQCRVTMQYKQRTEFKQLTMTQLGNVTYPEVFVQKTATHVVTAVLYGAEAYMVFDQTASNESEKQDIEGNLDVMIKKIPFIEISGSGKVVLTDEEKRKVREFSCTFHGDFTLKQNPSTYEEAVLVYRQLPQLLGEKGENAVPVRVWLYPLEKLDSKAAKLVREIRTKLVADVEDVVEQLHKAKMRANDLISQCEAIKAANTKDKLTQFQEKLRGYTAPLLHILGKLLPAIRAGTEEEQKLADILKSHEESFFTHSKMYKWLDGKESEVGRLRSYIDSVPCFPVVPPGPQLENTLFSPKVELVIMFTFTSLEYEEPYLSNLSECLASMSESRRMSEICGEALPWYRDPKISKRMRQVLKYAETLVRYFKEYKPIISYMTDVSHPGASIRVYHHGDLITPNLQDCIALQEVSQSVNHVTLSVSSMQPYKVEHRKAEDGAQGDTEAGEGWTITNTTASKDELTISGLQPNTEYQVRVSFTTAEGTSFPGNATQICTREPLAPERLWVERVSSRSARLRWETPTKMEEVTYTFSITYTCEGEEPKEVKTGSNSNVADLHNLKPGVEYSFSVCTVAVNGSRSRACSARAHTLPSAPRNLNVFLVHKTSICLSWERSTDMEGVTYTFKVTYWPIGDSPKIITTDENSTVLSDLKPGTEYRIKVCTVLKSNVLESEPVETTVCTFDSTGPPVEREADFELFKVEVHEATYDAEVMW